MWPGPSEEQDSAPATRSQAAIRPTRKPTKVPGSNSLMRGQTPETRGTKNLQPVERRLQTQEVKQNKMTKR